MNERNMPGEEHLDRNIGNLISSTQPTLSMPETSKAQVLSVLLEMTCGAASKNGPTPDPMVDMQPAGQATAQRVPEVPTELVDGVSRGTARNEAPPNPWHAPRRLMAMLQRRTVRWSAVAAVLVITFVGVEGWLRPKDAKSGIAFADVVQHFVDACSAKYTVIIELEGQEPVKIQRKQDFDSQTKGWGIWWDHSGPMGIQMLPRDWASSPSVADPLSEGFQGETLYFFGRTDGECMQDFFQVMGEVYRQAQAILGNQEIEGQPAAGFRVEQEGTVYSIWANAATGLPLLIEITNPRLLGQGRVTVKDFEFDVQITRPPMGMGGFAPNREWKWQLDEDGLINAMRRWADRRDGRLPRYLVHQAWFFTTPGYFASPRLSMKDRQQIFERDAQVIIEGLLFASQLPPGTDWNYLGKGMTFDPQDDQTPIFWYRPEGAQTFHVVYRNLTVRKVAPDQLPPATMAH